MEIRSSSGLGDLIKASNSPLPLSPKTASELKQKVESCKSEIESSSTKDMLNFYDDLKFSKQNYEIKQPVKVETNFKVSKDNIISTQKEVDLKDKKLNLSKPQNKVDLILGSVKSVRNEFLENEFKSNDPDPSVVNIESFSELNFGKGARSVVQDIDNICSYSKSCESFKEKIGSETAGKLENINSFICGNPSPRQIQEMHKSFEGKDKGARLENLNQIAKDNFVGELNSSITNVKDNENFDSVESIDGVEIKKLEGKSFNFYTHTSRNPDVNNLRFDGDGISSVSYFGDDKNTVMNKRSFIDTTKNKEAITFGYNDIDNKKVVSANCYDALINNNVAKEERVSNFLSPSDFSANTNSYSEIAVMGSQKPDYIVSVDNVKEKELEIAKNLNIPIVSVSSENYKQEKNHQPNTSALGKWYSERSNEPLYDDMGLVENLKQRQLERNTDKQLNNDLEFEK